MSSLPEDLYLDILSRVPAESLLACKCVCRNWYALISTSEFVKLHLHLTSQKNNPILLLQKGMSFKSVNYSLGYDSPVPEIASEMIYPFKSFNSYGRLLGTCNGLVCIWLSEYDGRSLGKDFLYLWNPVTREYKEIPKSPIEVKRSMVSIHTLCYDHKNDDYKFAIGVELGGSMINTLVQVYTLSSNSWKTEQTIPYWFCEETPGVLFNGDLHWIVMAQSNCVLLSLDIRDESFNEMQLPDRLEEKNDDLCMVLGVLEGCLCNFVSSYVNDVRIGFEVWEMLDYGVQESWIKRYVIAHDSIINDRNYIRLVWSSKNGDILLLSCESLVLYDPKHGSARELKFNDTFLISKLRRMEIFYADNYFQSLVSLNSGTYVRTRDD